MLSDEYGQIAVLLSLFVIDDMLSLMWLKERLQEACLPSILPPQVRGFVCVEQTPSLLTPSKLLDKDLNSFCAMEIFLLWQLGFLLSITFLKILNTQDFKANQLY